MIRKLYLNFYMEFMYIYPVKICTNLNFYIKQYISNEIQIFYQYFQVVIRSTFCRKAAFLLS